MVRGRRNRLHDAGMVGFSQISGKSHLIKEQICASPKRKECKLDEVLKNSKPIEPKNAAMRIIFGAKTRSQTIKHYFKSTDDNPSSSGYPNDYRNSFSEDTNANMTSSIDLTEDETCDEFMHYKKKQDDDSLLINDKNKLNTTNIFLQKPVLSLNVDKSPNQPSSIRINKSFVIDPIFPSNNYQINLHGQLNEEAHCSSAVKQESEYLHSYLHYDSNSCDSGVVIDNKQELSPRRRRKPTTPHRILCPSPGKHASIEKSPCITLSNYSLMNVNTSSNNVKPVQKKNIKSKRLNLNQSENNSSTAPELTGAEFVANDCFNNNVCSKSVLNSATNPTAKQNSNNNNKKRTNGHHQIRQTKNLNSGNKELTDYFPVRRSVRKTKKVVQEEIMKSIEKAIVEELEDGLKVVEHFEGKGRGIVAERGFKRGEFVVEYIGDLITIAEANQRERKYSLDENAGCYMYYFKHKNQQYCIDATTETGKLGRLVNHSRNGNLITKIVDVKSRPHLVLIAKEDIQPGDELTYDYGDRSKEALLHHPWLAL